MAETTEKTGSGMQPNVAAGISYIFGFISGLIIYLIEKEDDFVRFHAMQSILFNVAIIVAWIALTVVGVIGGFIPVVGIIIGIVVFLGSMVLWIGSLVFWIILLIKAFQGERFHLPYIGEMAEKYAKGS